MRCYSTFYIAVTVQRVGTSGLRIQAGGKCVSPLCPGRPWGLPSTLLSGYRGYFPGFKRQRRRVLATHARLASRLKMSGTVSLLPSMPSLCGQEQLMFCTSYYPITFCLLKGRVVAFNAIKVHIYFMENFECLITFCWIILIISRYCTKLRVFFSN